jgi:hypothetical protein
MHTITAFLAIVLSFPLAYAQTPPPQLSQPDPQSPVGHWIADHPAKESLALWWDFRSDGTLTLSAGGISTGTYKLAGDILTLPPSEPGAAPGIFTIHFAEGKLYTTSHADHPSTMEFTRTGSQTSNPTIVGIWRVSNAPHSTDPTQDPTQEKLRSRMLDMITIYGTDGSYHARIPIQTITGHWNAAAHTYTLKDHPALHYERHGKDLQIATPPEGKEQHLYHADTIFNP